ncbi:Imm8 family immunity protein [Pseudoduganella aquatica]|uniref:Imm8 family immunity protein n=1 Tax=Pseudoduganella aquatica TaxID=2660641 RepID=UPI001E3FB6D3|nr:Imm8 family immunity protein [Pseudoduganella aquatica]
MKAELKSLDLSSSTAFEDYRPENALNFGIYVTATIGPLCETCGDLFQILVCSRIWFNHRTADGLLLDCRRFEFDGPYSYSTVVQKIKDFVADCEGGSWDELAKQLSIKTHWEFESYRM